MRFKDKEEGVIVYNETSFFACFGNKRPNDPFWNKVEVCQTCVKSKFGCGEPIYVQFFAPLNE